MNKKAFKPSSNNTMTIDNVPEVIDFNQFYVFFKKTGKIAIGTTIGKSAITNIIHYEINGVEYHLHQSSALSTNNPITTFESNKVIGYLYKKDLDKAYEEYMVKKEKNKKQYKTHYIVFKDTYICKATKSTKWYNVKSFDNKEDAVNYANKGLAKTNKAIKQYIETFKKLKAILEEINKEMKVNDTTIYNYIVKPSVLNVNDLLVKIETKRYSSAVYSEIIKEDGVVTVKGFVTPQIANLSNGTILIESECNSYDGFIKYENKDEVKKRMFANTVKLLIKDVQREIESLERIGNFLEKYVPLVTKVGTLYFSQRYTKKLMEGIKEFLKDNNINV